MVAATHGSTNTVDLDHRRGTARKQFTAPTDIRGLWHCAAREAAALRVAAGTGLGPSVIEEGDSHLVLNLVEGVPFPIAFANAAPAERRQLAFAAGRALGAVHRVVPDAAQAPDWQALRLPVSAAAWPDAVGELAERLGVEVADRLPELAEAVRRLDRLVSRWCADLPAPTVGLVHADYGGANVLVGPGGR